MPGDKWAHCAVSACLVPVGARLAAGAGADDGTAIACGIVLSAYLGVVKEYSDMRSGGRFDGYDLLADLAGIALGGTASGLAMED